MRTLLPFALLAVLTACSHNLQTGDPTLTDINGNRAVAGEIVVKFKSGPSMASLRTLSGSNMVQSMSGDGWGTLARVQVPKGHELSYIQSYSRQSGVEYAEPNYWIATPRDEGQTLNLTPGLSRLALPSPITDPYFVNVPAGDPFATASIGGSVNYSSVPFLWGIYRVKAPETWATGVTGSGVVVGVVDEGADLTHPDLAPNLWVNPSPSTTCPGTNGYDFVDDDTDPSDSGGHGTHTAGTVLAAANGQGVVGVAPEAKLMVLRALGYFGGTNFMLARALKYAADCGAKVSNNSWGSSARSKAFEDVLGYGTAKGVTYVFSAGNNYRSANPTSYPAAYSTTNNGIVAVGAVSPNNARTGFSSTGSYVTVAAPGQAIMSTVPVAQGNPGDPYAFLQGTSMAAPHVSGVVALMYSAKPGIKPDQVRSILQSTANSTLTGQTAVPDYTSTSTLPEKLPGSYGYGLVDALAAVNAAKALP